MQTLNIKYGFHAVVYSIEYILSIMQEYVILPIYFREIKVSSEVYQALLIAIAFRIQSIFLHQFHL